MLDKNQLILQLKQSLFEAGIQEDRLKKLRVSKKGMLLTEWSGSMFMIVDKHEMLALNTFDAFDKIYPICLEFLKSSNPPEFKHSHIDHTDKLSSLINNFLNHHVSFNKTNYTLNDWSLNNLKSILACQPNRGHVNTELVKLSKKGQPIDGTIKCTCGFKAKVLASGKCSIESSIGTQINGAIQRKIISRKEEFIASGSEQEYLDALAIINSIENTYWPSDRLNNAKAKLESEKKRYLSATDDIKPSFILSDYHLNTQALVERDIVLAFIKKSSDRLNKILSAEYLKDKVYRDLNTIINIKRDIDQNNLILTDQNSWRCGKWLFPELAIKHLNIKIQSFFDEEQKHFDKIKNIPGCGIITDALFELQDEKMGRITLAKILSGSQAKDITTRNLNNNQWHGKLSHIKQIDIVNSIDALMAMGIITVSYFGRHNLPLINIKKDEVVNFISKEASAEFKQAPAPITASQQAEQLSQSAFNEGDWLAEFNLKAQAALRPYSQAAKLLKQTANK